MGALPARWFRARFRGGAPLPLQPDACRDVPGLALGRSARRSRHCAASCSKYPSAPLRHHRTHKRSCSKNAITTSRSSAQSSSAAEPSARSTAEPLYLSWRRSVGWWTRGVASASARDSSIAWRVSAISCSVSMACASHICAWSAHSMEVARAPTASSASAALSLVASPLSTRRCSAAMRRCRTSASPAPSAGGSGGGCAAAAIDLTCLHAAASSSSSSLSLPSPACTPRGAPLSPSFT
mmetsp:Transcript_22305/g.58117  ORF Transcript_22305/g.58117 Transcript_22305/m.58117 type:complete len:239 (+) Transcript_22305:221-937(+)